MKNFISLECKSCGNANTFKRKGNDFICGCCGRTFFEKQSDEAMQCEIAYNALKQYRFDEAKDIFESIFARKHPNSIDARWGYLLAEYRVVFIKGFYNDAIEPIYCYDKYEMQKTRCFTNEVEYEKILKLLKDNDDIRISYKKKAEKINDAIENFRKCKGKTDNDVFICVKISAATEKNPEKEGHTKEFEWAEKLYDDLKRRGKRPFFSFRTFKNQVDSDHLIWTNLVKSKKMVLIGSREEYIESAWVKSEWKRWLFLDRQKDFYIFALPNDRQSAFDILPKELSNYQHYTADRYSDLLEDLCAKEEGGNISVGYEYDPEYKEYLRDKEERRKAAEEAERKKQEEKERKEREAAARKQRELEEQRQREAAQQKMEAERQKLVQAEEERQKRANADIERRKAEIDSLDLTNKEDLEKYESEVKKLRLAVEKEKREREAALRKAKEAKAELGKSREYEEYKYQREKQREEEEERRKAEEEAEAALKKSKFERFKKTLIASLVLILILSITGVIGIGVIDDYYGDILLNKNASKGLEYLTSENTATITGIGTCKDKDIVIPVSINGKKVTGIGANAFYECDNLTSITMPESVTSIGDKAFYFCDSLESITIPNSVTSIGDEAFISCDGLTSITIPNSVTSIGNYAFSYCSSLTSITIPNSVTSIGKYAFSNCSSLTSITIPDSVTSIGYGAFSGCSSLTSITIPESVTSIGYGAFSGCSSLTSITIPNSVTTIGDEAFSDCSSLTSITMPVSVTSIGGKVFCYCSNLKDITYEGTKDSWRYMIDKPVSWYYGMPTCTVYCTDGNISVN